MPNTTATNALALDPSAGGPLPASVTVAQGQVPGLGTTLSAKRAIADSAPHVGLSPWGPVTDRLVFHEQQQYTTSGTTLQLTYRSRHTFAVATPFVRIVWCNYSGPTGQPSNAVTLKASIDVFPANGTYNAILAVPVTFGGQSTQTNGPSGFWVSDPIWGPFAAGDSIMVRSAPSVASAGQSWPIGMTLNRAYEGVLSGDQTAALNFNTTFVATGPSFTPCLIAGPTNPRNRVTIAGVGDSIMDGAGDTPFSNNGFLARAIGGDDGIASGTPLLAGYLRIAEPGETAYTAAQHTGNNVGAIGMFCRGIVAATCSHVVCNYGTNDLGTGRTLAQLQADLITIWTGFAVCGRLVYQTTINPRTTSTDSWATAVNQTPLSWESSRTTFNDWVRAGAPMVNGVAVAVGTNGALVAGQIGHPLTGMFDTAATVEVNAANVLTINGGRYFSTGIASEGTSDGIHPGTPNAIRMATAIPISSLVAA